VADHLILPVPHPPLDFSEYRSGSSWWSIDINLVLKKVSNISCSTNWK
jgi:hypothetical protein